MPVPHGFGKSPEMRKVLSLKSKIPEVSTPYRVVKQNWEDIVYDVCAGLSASDISIKYKVGRATFFRILQRIGIRLADIQKACKAEAEFKEKTREEKLKLKQQRLKMIPRSYEELFQHPVIEELVKQLKSKGVVETTIKGYARTWLELVTWAGKSFEDLTINDLVDFVLYKQMEWENKKKDLRRPEVYSQFSSEVKTPLRVLAKFLGLPLPPALETSRYESPYRRVRIKVYERYGLLKWFKEHEKMLKKMGLSYELMRAVMVFLYETGSRAAALTNVQFIETERYGVRVYYAVTHEKGKKTLIRWEKPINPEWYCYIRGHLPLQSQKMLEKVRRVLKKAYEEVIEDPLTRHYALHHPIHIWRHTAANDLLEATNYNLMLVARKLGWKSPDMIVQVYGTMEEAMLLKLSGYDIKYEAAKFEFLYNEWKKLARAEGLI